MNERTTVRLPAELLKRAKRKAVAEGRTLTALIEEGLRLLKQRDELQQEIAIGLEEANRGELEPLDIEAIKAEGRQRLTEARPAK